MDTKSNSLMKNKVKIFSAIAASAILGACVEVDKEVAETPTKYWKAPKDAIPENVIEPEQIKTNEIVAKNDTKKTAEQPAPAADRLLAGQTLDLSDIVDIALENNTQTRIYWFQAKSYAANLGKANSAYYPQVSVGAQVYRSKTNPSLGYAMGLPIGAYYETGFGPSAEINWLLYDFGQREARVESAREALRVANFDYNQMIQTVVLDVNVAYYKLYSAMAKVKTANMTLKDAQTTYDSASRKYKDGVGNKQDMLNALANVKNAEFTLESANSEVETARANLAKAMGVRVNDSLKISDSVNLPKSDESAKKVDELIAKAMRSRQTLLASYAQLRKTKADTKAAKRSFLPSIGAQASGTYLGYVQDERGEQYAMQAGLTFSWSVFEGFSRTYDLINAKVAERAQAQKLKAEEIRVISDVWAAYHNYKSALKQIASSKAAVDASLEAYDATKIGYDNGVNSITDLLNSQSLLSVARQQQVNADANLAISIAKLSYATGALIANTDADVASIPEKSAKSKKVKSTDSSKALSIKPMTTWKVE